MEIASTQPTFQIGVHLVISSSRHCGGTMPSLYRNSLMAAEDRKLDLTHLVSEAGTLSRSRHAVSHMPDSLPNL
jgi:hypothetical protein